MAQPYLGEIRMFSGNFAIKNWAMCNGQTMSIAQYTALFSILGTMYGGNGVSTFNLPNMQGRLPVHQGQGNGLPPYTVGQATGFEKVTLTLQTMPAHTHTFTPQANNGAAAGSRPGGGYLANSGGTSIYATSQDGTTMAPQGISTIGGSLPFSIIQPVLCITFLIALVGIFPSRN